MQTTILYQGTALKGMKISGSSCVFPRCGERYKAVDWVPLPGYGRVYRVIDAKHIRRGLTLVRLVDVDDDGFPTLDLPFEM